MDGSTLRLFGSIAFWTNFLVERMLSTLCHVVTMMSNSTIS
jgi:hypothetical protein